MGRTAEAGVMTTIQSLKPPSAQITRKEDLAQKHVDQPPNKFPQKAALFV